MGVSRRIYRQEERDLLHRFRRRAYPYVGRTMTAGEAIFLARHHSLPTRLLEWTANALISLYFACSENQDKCAGQVWALQYRSGGMDLDVFKLARRRNESALFRPLESRRAPAHPSAEYAIKVIHPFYNSPRLLAQDGAFTIHYDPWHSIEHYQGMEFGEDYLDIEKLYSWIIPEASKARILEDLSSLGITQRTVYPDLDGVAASLWQTDVLWSGTSQ
jgi:hypothetical protein